MRFLLDTCTISDLAKPDVQASLMAWTKAHDVGETAISVMTVGEIRRGIESSPPGRRRDSLQTWLSQDVVQRFQGRVLSVTTDIAERWGTLGARAQLAGRHLSTTDGLILATASVHGLAIVTRNERHFSGYDVHVINPWQPDEA